jgi:NAD(P)-dependent dehydrogenase (short-subunit alcohol dehydrogenase family)
MGLAETFTPAQMRQLFDVNVFGVQRVNRAVLPAMRAQGSGLLVHISSTIGRMLLPSMTPYCASKFALEALAEGYRYELAPVGIDSVLVEPGAFPTDIGANSLAPADPGRAAGYGPLAGLAEQMGAGMAQMFAIPNPPHPQEVADAVLRLVSTPAGQRSLRTVVDRMSGQGAEALNGVAARVAEQMLNAMQLEFLLKVQA